MLKAIDCKQGSQPTNYQRQEDLDLYNALGLDIEDLKEAILIGSESDQMLAIWNACDAKDKAKLMKAMNRILSRSSAFSV